MGGAAGRAARRDAAPPQRGRDPVALPGLAEPLTGRELEVLRLLAAARADPLTPPQPARYHLRVRDHRAASFHPAGTFG